ncbi:MAG TPA: hypothetical protein VFA10_18890 [Ktedonobacteraceae bacterium]|nr:hypothetical protein [Ktedonobacteraceae bacterium]
MSPHESQQKAIEDAIQAQFEQQVDFLKLLVRAKITLTVLHAATDESESKYPFAINVPVFVYTWP